MSDTELLLELFVLRRKKLLRAKREPGRLG
jgi:hypothetical protein